MRAYDARRDLESLCDLAEVAYAADYARIGRRASAGVERERRVVAALSLLGRIFPRLRDLSLGYVWEDRGRIVSAVCFARVGLSGDRWSIETVATHPDHRRCGLARRLVERAVVAIRDRGGSVCTLKARADNEAAYALYQDLGFEHYDSTWQLRADAIEPSSDAEVNGYRLRAASSAEWFRSWSDRLDLARRETPEAVQRILPVAASQVRRPGFARVVAPALARLSGRRVDHVFVECGGRLVATLAVHADVDGGRTHEFDAVIDPDHLSNLAVPLVDRALGTLAGVSPAPVLTETRPSNTSLLDALADRRFEAISRWHWLGRRLSG